MRQMALCVAIALSLSAVAPLADGGTRAIDGYAGYDEVKSALEGIVSEYPGFASLESLGTTFEGREILALRLCAGSGPAALVMGGHHAREPASAEMALEVARTLADGYGSNGTARWLLDNREIWIVPMVNPDGIEYVLDSGDAEWRKNRRPVDADGDGTADGIGVDLNRNYGHLWGLGNSDHDPTSQQYCGPAAFSEAETRAIRALAERENFSASVSFHSYGEVVYYTPNNDQDARGNATMEAFASEVAERNGYAPMEGWTAYPTYGDSDDWLYANMSVAAVTVELGTSFFPAQTERDAMKAGNVAAALYACEMAGRVEDAALPDWTLAVYMAADNSLSDQAILDLNEMEAAPASADVNVVVLHDGAGHGDTVIRKIAHDADPWNVTSPVVSDGGTVIDPLTGEADMSEASTLSDFLDWARASYPSQRFGVVLWDHGADVLGGLCVDGGRWLGTADACEALRGSAADGLDFVGLDLCWGASLEMAAELAGSARTFVASELEEPDTGWEYAGVVGALASDPNLGPDELGKAVVASYKDEYSWVGYGSMGAFSLPLIGEVADAWSGLAGTLAAYAYYEYDEILSARNATGGIWLSKPNLVDAADFCVELSKTGIADLVKMHATGLREALASATLASFSGFSAAKATGLYVYHPAAGGYAADYGAFDSAEAWRQYLSELASPAPRAWVTAGAAPLALNTTGPYTFEAWLTEPDGANVTLHHTQAGAWVGRRMAHAGGGRFIADAPGQPDGSVIQYYFESEDVSGFVTRLPAGSGVLTVTVDAYLDLRVGTVNLSGAPRVGEIVHFTLDAGNEGMQPCWASVKLYSPDGLLVNETLFLRNGASEVLAGNWTPSADGNASLVATIAPANGTVEDSVAGNDTSRLELVVAPRRASDSMPVFVGIASIGAAAVAALMLAARSRRRRNVLRVRARLAHASGLVDDLERGGYEVSGARKELTAAREYLDSDRYEWAERAAERAESQAIESVSKDGGANHG